MAIDLMTTYAPQGTACDRISRAMLVAVTSLVPGLANYKRVDRWSDVSVDEQSVRVIVEPGEVINREDGSAYAGSLEVSVMLRAPADSGAATSWDMERADMEACMHNAPALVAALREADNGLPESTRWTASTESAAGVDGDVAISVYSGTLYVPAPLTPIKEI